MENDQVISNTIDTLPVVSTADELEQLMNGTQPTEDGASPKQQQQQQKTTKPAATVIGQTDGDDDSLDEGETTGQQQQKKPAEQKKITNDPTKITQEFNFNEGEGEVDIDELISKVKDHPSAIHWLNEVHELGLNLEGMEQMTAEQQAEVLHGVVSKMTSGVNNALEQYQYIEELLKDDEIQSVLKAKHEGKKLADLFPSGGSSTQSDDDLVLNNFKSRFPKSDEAAIRAMVDSLKKNGQFEPFVKSLRDQQTEEQSLQQKKAEDEAKRLEAEQQQREQQEYQEYLGYVDNLTEVYGIPLTPEMKKGIVKLSTQRDAEGNTYLDYALQSNQGTVLATLGIAYLKNMVENASSLEGNRKRNRLMNRIFETPDPLQGAGGTGGKKDDDYDPALLDKF